ncbi:G-type lectin S-receptor-like serine/threonine-protein kinase [Vitis vinifera]|uniref:G-type lectin S-receptor-like serine/threonine-protein kinase n=1 Tax=Vitis vinifera TaxID=29760 RepID=A0A438DP46_VITVI|nr:G-type lectin S-receptor-like serine/threonine-protein kinase [Vitis vinifera]
MDALTTVVFIFSYVFSLLRISTAVDTITINQHIRAGETITSAGGTFELGFFSPGNSKNRYLGIWYKKVAPRTVVWVANRESPLTDSFRSLKVTQQGTLVLVNDTNGILWNSSSSRSAQDPNAQLLESGNLVMRNGNDGDPENFLWQSFDYPCDTLLPGMKLGRNRVTGLDRNGLDVEFRAGPWDVNSSVIMRLVLTPDGKAQRFTYTDKKNEWTPYSTAQRDDCDDYAICGVYGICKIDESPKCECMKGFRPKFQSNWDMADWSKWMHSKHSAGLSEGNCSCTAYANSDIRGGGSGCLLWFGDLIDIRDFTQNGQEFYVRMAASELGYMDHNSRDENNEGQAHLELPLFDLDTLLNATNNFSSYNKLGEGGFGPVL